MKSKRGCYHGYRFPPQIISHGVWLYHRFSLSFRDVDEVFVKIRGVRHYLWRAVDQDGDVIDILVQRYRNHHTARYENNRAEVAHQPTRQRERQIGVRLRLPEQSRSAPFSG